MTSSIDYTKTHFIYATLTPITGKPNYESLKLLKDELKANATSVPSDLGGGLHGHLYVVLSTPEFALVSPVPFVRPGHPGPLVIPAGTANYMRQELRENHKENLRVFHEVHNVETTLKKQIVKAIPEFYIKRFIDRTTNTLTADIPVVLAHLFRTYGKISPDHLLNLDTELRKKVFDITQPLVLLYNEVEDLQELATAAQNPYTDTQLVNLGIRLIKNMADFEKGLTDWYARPAATNTWVNFKTHFEDAYEALSLVRGETMQNTLFQNQANAVTTKVLQEIKEDNEQVRAELKQSEQKLCSILEEISQQNATPPLTTEPPEQKANSTKSDTVMLEVLKALKDLKETRTPHKRRNENNDNESSGGDDNSDGGGKKKKKTKKKYRYNTSKYCWSCGAWNHFGKDCRNKKPGHKDEATFQNMMGGNTAFCQVCT